MVLCPSVLKSLINSCYTNPAPVRFSTLTRFTHLIHIFSDDQILNSVIEQLKSQQTFFLCKTIDGTSYICNKDSTKFPASKDFMENRQDAVDEDEDLPVKMKGKKV